MPCGILATRTVVGGRGRRQLADESRADRGRRFVRIAGGALTGAWPTRSRMRLGVGAAWPGLLGSAEPKPSATGTGAVALARPRSRKALPSVLRSRWCPPTTRRCRGSLAPAGRSAQALGVVVGRTSGTSAQPALVRRRPHLAALAAGQAGTIKRQALGLLSRSRNGRPARRGRPCSRSTVRTPGTSRERARHLEGRRRHWAPAAGHASRGVESPGRGGEGRNRAAPARERRAPDGRRHRPMRTTPREEKRPITYRNQRAACPVSEASAIRSIPVWAHPRSRAPARPAPLEPSLSPDRRGHQIALPVALRENQDSA